MNTVADKINMELSWKDKIAYLLLFLFPVAGMSVRHWISAIFTFLVLHSFFYLSKKAAPLLKEEKTLLWILGIFFAVFVITALANGWTERQTKYLGVEIRYLLAIPLYLMVRRLPDAGAWVLRGCVLGGIILGLQAYYDIEVLYRERALGIYSPNLLGPFSVLVVFWSLTESYIKSEYSVFKFLALVSVILSIYALILSGSRGAYLGFVVIFIIWFMKFKDSKRLAFVVGTLVIIVAYAVTMKPHTSTRIDDMIEVFGSTQAIPVDNVNDYQSQNMPEDNANAHQFSSIEARLEMWRASWLFIKNNPVIGIGRGNYEVLMPEFIENGYAPKELELHGLGHPHNAYVEMLVSKGLIGLLVFLIMLFYPLSCFIKNEVGIIKNSFPGIVLIVGFSIFSITDASTFIKGNYTSIYLVFLSVFFSTSIREAYSRA